MVWTKAISLAFLRAKSRTVSFHPCLQFTQSIFSFGRKHQKEIDSYRTEYKPEGPIIPESTPKHKRTLVLCFDGTGDQFDNDNSNVVNFFSLLSKGDSEHQLVYYQSGIGTGETPQIETYFPFKIRKTLKMMFGNSLRQHVMDGYVFLMDHYKKGDRVCLFGFSRGAYTARALAGMVEKVGVLPAGNRQQVPFAYNMYKKNDDDGCKQSALFKESYSMDVDIEFVGVWDSVASVGITSTKLPFTQSNSRIKTFCHAISMDERRVKFSIDRFHGNSSEGSEGGHESLSHLGVDSDLGTISQGEHTDKPKETDVLEVWFAGCHADVGGGSVPNNRRYSLARIPLRWMIRQCFRKNSGVQFQEQRLLRVGLDPKTLFPKTLARPPPSSVENVRFRGHEDVSFPKEVKSESIMKRIDEAGHICNSAECLEYTRGPSCDKKAEGLVQSTPDNNADADIAEPEKGQRQEQQMRKVNEEHEELHDTLSPAFDRLELNPCWWILEFFPFFAFCKDKPFINKGCPRIVDPYKPINVHRSVQMRMKAKPEVLALNESYKPRMKFNLENTTWVD